MIPTLEWTSEGVRFIDQTKLPLEESYVLATSYEQVADVIVTMVVRGAPAIGVSAAMGIALGAKQTTAHTRPRNSRRSSSGSARSWPGPAPRPSISSGPSTA
jgi:methylthioribose-1-phosphate isomerase